MCVSAEFLTYLILLKLYHWFCTPIIFKIQIHTSFWIKNILIGTLHALNQIIKGYRNTYILRIFYKLQYTSWYFRKSTKIVGLWSLSLKMRALFLLTVMYGLYISVEAQFDEESTEYKGKHIGELKSYHHQVCSLIF